MSDQPAEVLAPDILGLIRRLHHSLERSGLPYAFGGALALAWCIPEPRTTRDVDLNIFIEAESAEVAVAALPPEIVATDAAKSELRTTGQTRLMCDTIPVDVFLTNDPFHTEVATRVVQHPFLGEQMPFLCCSDLAVFKAFFDRRKDWFDLGEMFEARSIDLAEMTTLIAELLEDPDDHRIAQLRQAHDDGERTRLRRAASDDGSS
ncbi:hypothetical protein [Candidatus Poriferisodalis sp.]|uniref:hypothetical protein n=1 Tax=Candidatus Poriferisodalis sp. TaxID=3101277 RepID=UPI003D0A1274